VATKVGIRKKHPLGAFAYLSQLLNASITAGVEKV